MSANVLEQPAPIELSPGHRARVLGVGNQSGGSCKTTTAVAWAAGFVTIAEKLKLAKLALAGGGYRPLRVLCVDADNQRDLSKIFGYDKPERIEGQPTIVTVLMNQAKPIDAVVPGLVDEEPCGIDVLLGAPHTPELERYVGAQSLSELWMVTMLESLLPLYDVILIDLPPARGIMGVGAIMGVDDMYATAKSQEKEIRGVTEFEETIIGLNAGIRTRLKMEPIPIRGVLLGELPPRNAGNVYQEWNAWTSDRYSDRFLGAIPRSVVVPEAYQNDTPLPIFDPKDPATLAYMRTAGTVFDWSLTAHLS